MQLIENHLVECRKLKIKECVRIALHNTIFCLKLVIIGQELQLPLNVCSNFFSTLMAWNVRLQVIGSWNHRCTRVENTRDRVWGVFPPKI